MENIIIVGAMANGFIKQKGFNIGKSLNEKNAYTSIIFGLLLGFLLFPTPDFSKSILVGILFPIEFFP